MANKDEKNKPKLSFKDRARELEKEFAQPEHDAFFIPTGSIGLDWATGGGWRTGKVYEIMAWEGSGKTTIAKHAIAELQKLNKGEVVVIDAEHAMDPKYAKAIGVNWKPLEDAGFFQPMYGEQGYEYAKELIKTGEVRLLVIDSMNGMQPKKVLEGEAGDSNLGLHARLQGVEVLKLKGLASQYNCAVICISQFREKIGVMFGSPETTQGGNGLRFWADCRIDLRKAMDKEGDQEVGIISKVKVVKNKIVSPYRRCHIPIKFGVGIDKLQEVIDLGKEFGLLKTRAGIITFEENKYPEADFLGLMNDNPEFYTKLKNTIISKLNSEDAETIMENAGVVTEAE